MPQASRRPPALDWLAILLLCLLVQAPGLLHWIDSDPLPLLSPLGEGGRPGWLPGFPGWIDPNVGTTTQALGHLAAADWLAGRLPWWNPYSGIGAPLAAEMQPAALFLPFVLLLRLHDGLLWLRVAMCALGGIGAYELARALGYRRRACLVAGVLFAFNGTAAWLPHGPERVAALLPWMLLGIERAREAAVAGRRLGWLGLAAATAASVYAGFPEVAYIDGLLVAVWAAWRLAARGAGGWRVRARLLAKLGGAVLLALLLCAPAVLPFGLYLLDGDVGGHVAGASSGALPAPGFPLFLLPYLYGPIDGFGTVGDAGPTSAIWNLIGGYVGAAPCVLALLRLVAGRRRDRRRRDGGLRWVLLGWIVACLARTAALPGATPLIDLVPLLHLTAFLRLAEPSWEFSVILLAAAAIDDSETPATTPTWRPVLASAAALLLAAGALALGWRTVAALWPEPGYAAFPILSVGWAVTLAVALPWLLGRGGRRAAACALAGVDALAMFALPLASAAHGVRLDRAPLEFLRTHLGLQRFYTLAAVPANYGALFGLAQINDDMLPVPRLWSQHVRAALDPGAQPITFTGSSGGRAPGQDPRAMLLAHLPAYTALGVRYVVTPRLADSLDGQVASAPLYQQGTPLVLAPGATVGGSLPAGFAQGHPVTDFGVLLGTYHGASDGDLAMRLCAQRGCAEASVPLRTALDGGVLSAAFPEPLATAPGEVLRFTIAHRGGTHPVVAWMLPGSVARLDGRAGSGPRIVLDYATGGAAFHRVFRDPHVDIFELSGAAPYFSTDAGCVLQAVERTVVSADCPRPATLTRRELAFPGWRATLDGQRARVGSDGLFQTVALPAGRSVVEFLYAPPYIGFAWAAAAWGVVWAALALAFAASPMRLPAAWLTLVDMLRPDPTRGFGTASLRVTTAALLAVSIAGFWASEAHVGLSFPRLATVEFSLASPTTATLRLFVDSGHGLAPAPAAAIGIAAAAAPLPYRTLLRTPAIRRLRLEMGGLSPPASLTVCCDHGAAATLSREPGRADYTARKPLRFDRPVAARACAVLSVLLRLSAASLFAALCWQVLARLLAERARLRAPVSAVVAVAALATVASLYPVVFFERSLVSPGNGGTWLAYPAPPFVPGGPAALQVADVHGADTGANAWQYRSYSAVQAAALRGGEWPLLNRYSSFGVSLLGQGTSQLGDPLHWLTIAANGAGWAWDGKFLLAKTLFCAGAGTAVWLATASAGAALLLTGSVAFLGVFLFRLSHPAFFALAYAPWLWVGFVLMTQPAWRGRRRLGLGLLLLATWMEMNTGAVKEGYVAVLLAFASGGVMALAAAVRERRAGPLGRVVLAGVLVPLLTAPWWLSFFLALQHAINYAPNKAVGVLPPVMAPLLLDNAFQAALLHGQLAVPGGNPTLVLLALVGLVAVPAWIASPVLLPAALASLLCLAVAFSVVPPAWVGAVPLVGEIGHVADVFLLSSLTPLALLAGGGAAWLLEQRHASRRALAVAAAAALAAAPVLRFALVTWASPDTDGHVFQPGPIVLVLAGLGVALAALLRGPAWRRSAGGAAALLGGLLAANLPYGLHLPFLARAAGQTLTAPAARVDFAVASPAIEQARALSRTPYRIVGSDGFFFPGYNAALLIEGTNGPEPLIAPAYHDFMQAQGFEDTFGWGYLHLVHWGDFGRLGRALDVAGVRAVLAGPGADAANSAAAGRFVAATDMAVIERPGAWPRAFWTDRVRRGNSAADFSRALADSDGRPFAMLPPGHPPFAPGNRVAPASGYTLTSNTTRVAFTAPAPGVLVLGETDLGRELHATLDGAPVRPVRVNAAFQGYVIARPGAHVLLVRFVPAGWRAGWVLAAAGLAIVAAVAVPHWRRRRAGL